MFVKSKLITRGSPLLGLALICTSICLVTSKQLKSPASLSGYLSTKCVGDECSMSPAHFYLYHSIKTAVESNFDIKGKEILPLLRAVDVLDRRFNDQDGAKLNGSQLVRSLISSKPLVEAIKIFKSDEGRALVDLYRSPVNGKQQNLACSPMRVQDINRAIARLKGNKEFGILFRKIHENYVRRSAKKCLKSSCTTVENSMSNLESILAGRNSFNSNQNNEMVQPPSDEDKSTLPKREFECEELELCRFFKKSNQSTCTASGLELSDIVLRPETGLIGDEKITVTPISELLEFYYDNNIAKETPATGLNATAKLDKAKEVVLGNCRRINSLLDYNLAAVKWYREQNYIDEHKILSRTFWCPSLSYWMQIDRLCTELATDNISIADDNNVGKPTTLEYQLDRTKPKPQAES